MYRLFLKHFMGNFGNFWFSVFLNSRARAYTVGRAHTMGILEISGFPYFSKNPEIFIYWQNLWSWENFWKFVFCFQGFPEILRKFLDFPKWKTRNSEKYLIWKNAEILKISGFIFSEISGFPCAQNFQRCIRINSFCPIEHNRVT